MTDQSKHCHHLFLLLPLQALWVQDPPDGLPAAAASRLKLQEPRQGYPLERPGLRVEREKPERKELL